MDDSPQVNINVASPARVYDAMLGGSDNFPVDRAAAQAVLEVDPRAAVMPRHNRDFLGRAVVELATLGIDQFLDIGSGLPTVGNVHEVAQAVNPAARVVYVDNDALTHNHAVALLKGSNQAAFVLADIRSPEAILDAPETQRLIDWSRPVAILNVAVLHFVHDDADPAAIVSTLMGRAVPGSFLVISHLTSEGMPKALADRIEQVYGDGPAPLHPRSREQIRSFFGDLGLVDGQLDDVQCWHNDDPPPLEPMRLLCGVAVKTSTTMDR